MILYSPELDEIVVIGDGDHFRDVIMKLYLLASSDLLDVDWVYIGMI